MIDPKNELKLSKKEIESNNKVSKDSKTAGFKKDVEDVYRIKMDDNLKSTPIVQKRKIQLAKEGSGKSSRVIGEDGSVLFEAKPGSIQEKEMFRKLKLQEGDTNARRQNNADFLNYQNGEEDGNPVYDKKLNDQKKRVLIRK